MKYSLPTEHCRLISSLSVGCRLVSDAGCLGSLPHCSKCREHCLLGKLSELLRCLQVLERDGESEREIKSRKNWEIQRSSGSVGENSHPYSCIVTHS